MGLSVLGKMKHFPWGGWQSDLPAHSLSQDRGDSGSENKRKFSFLPGTGWTCQPKKMEECTGHPGLSRPIHSYSWNVNSLNSWKKMLSCLEFKPSVSTFQALKPLVYVFATTAHGKIYLTVILFYLSALWNVSPILACPLLPFQPPQAALGRIRDLKKPLQRAHCPTPLQQCPVAKPSTASTGQKLLHLLGRAHQRSAPFATGAFLSSLCFQRFLLSLLPNSFASTSLPHMMKLFWAQSPFIHLSRDCTSPWVLWKSAAQLRSR